MSRLSSRRDAPQGFTLVELLVVIGIITVLFAVILVAVDPARRLRQARDAVRRQDVRDILEAVQQYTVDNNGTAPTAIDSVTTSVQRLGTNASGCATACAGSTTTTACADLTSALVDTYLSAIPMDPLTGTAGDTDYAIDKTSGGRIQVIACTPEIASSITVKR